MPGGFAKATPRGDLRDGSAGAPVVFQLSHEAVKPDGSRTFQPDDIARDIADGQPVIRAIEAIEVGI